MADVKAKVLDNGPYLIKGEVEIVDSKGNLIEVKKECHLCRCGLSKKMPFCDGSHVNKFNQKVDRSAK